MATYRIAPIAFDVYGETKLYKNRAVTDAKLIGELVELMKTAQALGFKILRLTFHLPLRIVEAMIPHAEERGMKLALEVHAPHLLTGEWVQNNIELALRTGTRSLGLMPDMGIFCKNIPHLVLDEALRQGATPRIVDFMSAAYRERSILKDLVDQVRKMGGNETDEWLAMRLVIGVWTYHDPKNLLTYLPHILHIHGKFYEMTPDLVEPDVAYESIMPLLIQGEYDGYIMSEYETSVLPNCWSTRATTVNRCRHQRALSEAALEHSRCPAGGSQPLARELLLIGRLQRGEGTLPASAGCTNDEGATWLSTISSNSVDGERGSGDRFLIVRDYVLMENRWMSAGRRAHAWTTPGAWRINSSATITAGEGHPVPRHPDDRGPAWPGGRRPAAYAASCCAAVPAVGELPATHGLMPFDHLECASASEYMCPSHSLDMNWSNRNAEQRHQEHRSRWPPRCPGCRNRRTSP
ncbi:MAG: hypothetical protein U1F35_10050 [Steroidobacteraceae bacterium]